MQLTTRHKKKTWTANSEAESEKRSLIRKKAKEKRDNALTEEVTSLENAIRRPAKIELNLEKLLPVIRVERERLLSDKRSN